MPPRFFKHGELPLVLLALLDREPRHGYEIMAELTRLFGPAYKASPGSVYPAIEALHNEGLVERRSSGDKAIYETTDAGSQVLAERAEMLASLEQRVGVRLSDEATLDDLLAHFRARLAPLSGRVDPEPVSLVLARAASEIEALATQPASTTKESP